jgi:hypothetical protein
VVILALLGVDLGWWLRILLLMDFSELHQERLRKVILSAMEARTRAKHEENGFDYSVAASSPLFIAELESAADCISEAVWSEVKPLVDGMNRDNFIMGYLLEALGPACDDIYDMAVEAWEGE